MVKRVRPVFGYWSFFRLSAAPWPPKLLTRERICVCEVHHTGRFYEDTSISLTMFYAASLTLPGRYRRYRPLPQLQDPAGGY
jgi:hypothetical protein